MKLNSRILFAFGWLIITVVGISCNSKSTNCVCWPEAKGPVDTAVFSLPAETPDRQAVRIFNSGNASSSFSLQFNSGLFYDEDELVRAIINMPEEFAREPIERKAWRFVCSNVSYNYPVTDFLWQRNPLIMINSVGFDKCGNQAEILARLWQKLGFKTRIWSLGGHITPEVFAEDKWQMYDPSYQVFYKNATSNVCGVDELISNSNFITMPVERLPVQRTSAGVFVSTIRYSKLLAGIYASNENNEHYLLNNPKDAVPYKFGLCLPPGATFEFPMLLKPEFFPACSFLSNNYANARLVIPQDWEGEINIPLVVCAVTGKGNVMINGENFEMGSPALIKCLASFKEFNYQLKFSGKHSAVGIVYLVNAALWGLKSENNLKIFGAGVGKIKVEIFSPDTGLLLSGNAHKNDFDSILKWQYQKYELQRAEIDNMVNLSGKTNGYANIEEKISVLGNYFKMSYLGEESCNPDSLLQRFYEVKAAMPADSAGKNIFLALEEPSFLFFFTIMLDRCTSKEIVAFLTMNKKLKEKNKTRKKRS